jgi:hypothetical protein
MTHAALSRFTPLVATSRSPLLAALACLPFVCACLDRPEHEPIGYSRFVLDADAEVRPLERNVDAKMKLDLNDGLTSPVKLHTGFAKGIVVPYWDLGQSPTSAEPMWLLTAGEDAASELADHPPVIDSIPGDTAYSPIRILFAVQVTAKYQGQRIPSLRALEDAVELGLVLEPKPLDTFTNCVVTLEETEFESVEGPVLRPERAFYRDRAVHQFCVPGTGRERASFPLKMGSVVFGNAYNLRRENQTIVLDETALKLKLNEDDDQLDSNVVFDVAPGDAGYTSLWKGFEVVVPSGYGFAQIQSFEQLFDKGPGGLDARAQVIEYRDTMLVLNRPLLMGIAP